MRFFNTAGPCEPGRHYMISAAGRLPEAHRIIDQGGYFVVHAPWQTGKTTTLRALARQLSHGARYAALHFTCEEGEPAGDDLVRAQRAVLSAIRMAAEEQLAPELWPPVWPAAEDTTLLRAGLRAWAHGCPRPLVLLFDEIDALRGESLRAELRQLRAGYADRPAAFPWATVLCGLRDVRDHRVASGADADRLGTSQIANPIYREVIVRVLASPVERVVPDEPKSFLLPEGRLDVARLLREFAAFWREHGEVRSGARCTMKWLRSWS